MVRHTATAVKLVKTISSARENVLANPVLKYLTRSVGEMERHTATAVKLVKAMFNAKENVLAKSVLKYLTRSVGKMERHTAIAVKLVKTMFSVRENVLANPALKYLTRSVGKMERHTATAVKLVKTMFTAKENVLANKLHYALKQNQSWAQAATVRQCGNAPMVRSAAVESVVILRCTFVPWTSGLWLFIQTSARNKTVKKEEALRPIPPAARICAT